MEDLKFTEMSNSEIKLKIIDFENEYETVKNKISLGLKRLQELDVFYNNAKKELKKRKAL